MRATRQATGDRSELDRKAAANAAARAVESAEERLARLEADANRKARRTAALRTAAQEGWVAIPEPGIDVNMRGRPAAAQLRQFETCAIIALFLFWVNCGNLSVLLNLPTAEVEPRVREEAWTNATVPELCKPLWEAIPKPVTVEERAAALAGYQAVLNHSAPLLACGACGVRAYTTEAQAATDFPLKRLKELAPLQMTEGEMEIQDAIVGGYGRVLSTYSHKYVLTLPVDGDFVDEEGVAPRPMEDRWECALPLPVRAFFDVACACVQVLGASGAGSAS